MKTVKKLTHIDEKGRPKMVDVGSKPLTERMAVARGSVYMKKETFNLIKSGNVSKGDVLACPAANAQLFVDPYVHSVLLHH